jgi:hypothetical protein
MNSRLIFVLSASDTQCTQLLYHDAITWICLSSSFKYQIPEYSTLIYLTKCTQVQIGNEKKTQYIKLTKII